MILYDKHFKLIMIVYLLFFIAASDEELWDMDRDLLAQAFMERCIEQGEDETRCRESAIQMFGSSGNTKIDINMRKFISDIEALRDLSSYSGKGKQDLRSSTVPKSMCKKENTIYYGGQCHCKVGFSYGDPVKTGCWRCRPKCNSLATCHQLDGCICNNFTVGDGIKKCSTHIPKILKSYSKADEKTIMVIIEPVDWSFPHPAFCKFGNMIIEGQLISEDTIECIRKNRKRKESKVDVSWDSISFTHQRMSIEDARPDTPSSSPLIIAVILLVVVVSFYFFFLFQKKSLAEKKLVRYVENAEKRGAL